MSHAPGYRPPPRRHRGVRNLWVIAAAIAAIALVLGAARSIGPVRFGTLTAIAAAWLWLTWILTISKNRIDRRLRGLDRRIGDRGVEALFSRDPDRSTLAEETQAGFLHLGVLLLSVAFAVGTALLTGVLIVVICGA